METKKKVLLENRNEISNFLLFKTNYTKQIIFYIIAICLFFLPILVINIYEDLKKYLYEIVENIADADYIFMIFENENRSLIKIHTSDYKILPFQQKKPLRVINFSQKTYYYCPKKKIFLSISNKYLKYLKKNSKILRDLAKPLSNVEVEELNTFYGKNNFKIEKTSFFDYLKSSSTDPVYFFYSLLSLIFVLSGEPIFGFLVILGVIVMFFINRYHYTYEVDKINAMTFETPEITVFRSENGAMNKKAINSEDISVGDIIEIFDDQNINCDLVILRGECLINQSTLTGETTPIFKKEFNDEKIVFNNQIYSGSQIIEKRSSNVYAVVVATGFNSFAGNMISVLSTKNTKRFLLRTDLLNFFIFFFAIFFLVVTTRFVRKYLNGDEIYAGEVIFRYAQIIMTSFPFSIWFSLFAVDMISAYHLSHDKIDKLTKNFVAEAGRMKVICFDKTGTLTENSMKITKFYRKLENEFVFTESQHIGQKSENDFIFNLALGCCHSLIQINNRIVGDPMDQEMFNHSNFTFMQKDIKGLETVIHKEEQILEEQTTKQKNYQIIIKPSKQFRNDYLQNDSLFEILKINQFDSDKKRMSVIIENPSIQQEYLFLDKGAPEIICDLCVQDSLPDNYLETIHKYSRKGYRLLALSYKRISDASLPEEECEKEMIFLGFILYNNPLKQGVTDTISGLIKCNYKLCIITGDNLLTAINVGYKSSILHRDSKIHYCDYDKHENEFNMKVFNNDFAQKNKDKDNDSENRSLNSKKKNSLLNSEKRTRALGLFQEIFMECKSTKNSYIALTGEVLELLLEKFSMNNDFLRKLFKYCKIFGRTSPASKKLIVKYLKAFNLSKHYYVGFVGDGANDSDALYEADIGLSIGNQFTSLVAGYFTASDKIESIQDLAIEGKFALQNLIDLINMIIFFNILKNIIIILISYFDYNFTFYEYTLGFVLAYIYLGLPYFLQSSKKKSLLMPEIRLFSKPLFVTVILGIATLLLFTIWLVVILLYDERFKHSDTIVNNINNIAFNKHFFIEQKILSFAWYQILPFACFAFANSFPFKQSIMKNTLNLVFSIIFTVYGFSMFLEPYGIYHNYFAEYFLVRFSNWPNMSMAFKMKIFFFMSIFSIVIFFVYKNLNLYFLIAKAKASHQKFKSKFINDKKDIPILNN